MAPLKDVNPILLRNGCATVQRWAEMRIPTTNLANIPWLQQCNGQRRTIDQELTTEVFGRMRDATNSDNCRKEKEKTSDNAE